MKVTDVIKAFVGCLLALAICASGATATLLERTVYPIHIFPDGDAPIIARVDLTARAAAELAPADDDNATEDWRSITIPTPYQGYISAGSVTKGFQLKEDTPAHYLPESTAPLLTDLAIGDRFEVLDATGDWLLIAMHKPIVGYIQLISTHVPTMSHLPAPPQPKRVVGFYDTIGSDAFESLPEEVGSWKPADSATAPRTDQRAANADLPVSQVRSVYPKTTTYPKEVSQTEDLIVLPENTQAAEARSASGARSELRTIQGILRRSTDRPDAPFPLYLESSTGRLLAFVDLSQIYIADTQTYVGKRLSVDGSTYSDTASKGTTIIRAQNLQILD